MEDRRCKLGPAGRLSWWRLIEAGSTLSAAAAALNVAPATAHRWWHRWRAASEQERATRAWCRRAGRCRALPMGAGERGAGDPRRASEDQLGADAPDRADRPASLDDLEGAQAPRPSRRRRRGTAQTSRRYEWAEAGALLHIDAYEAAEVRRARSLGDRCSATEQPRLAGGQDGRDRRHRRPHPPGLLRAAQRRERRNVSATLTRAAAWFREQGCGPLQAVMSDNAKCYAPEPRFSHTLDRARRPPHPHPALHATLERQDRAVLRHPRQTNGHTAASGPTAPTATAPCHRSSASTTAQRPHSRRAADHPSAAFTKSASRTARPGRPRATARRPRTRRPRRP